jgi:hypothetical protein
MRKLLKVCVSGTHYFAAGLEFTNARQLFSHIGSDLGSHRHKLRFMAYRIKNRVIIECVTPSKAPACVKKQAASHVYTSAPSLTQDHEFAIETACERPGTIYSETGWRYLSNNAIQAKVCFWP